ncbi:hypothetical protein QTA57_11285 [Fontisubflavum oceani]|uniref:hypothetical protein n=1 Tax=Fontisubflavum oceani TaxID=2978973 RepID=UPI0025B38248|nr:hypothetical protein [Fontisubflavum oceani]WJY20439.1 hypothetical protein QTA57_11285 [Fontisubflavum oceani]
MRTARFTDAIQEAINLLIQLSDGFRERILGCSKLFGTLRPGIGEHLPNDFDQPGGRTHRLKKVFKLAFDDIAPDRLAV